MQEVELQPHLLKDFSLMFAKVPHVNLEGLEALPFEVRILGSWLLELSAIGSSTYMEVFQAYLCGQDMFLDEESMNLQQFSVLLASIIQESLDRTNKQLEDVLKQVIVDVKHLQNSRKEGSSNGS